MNELQASLFDIAPTVQPEYERNATIQRRFEQWLDMNPHVWRFFVNLCLDMKRRGLRRWSSKAAFEVMRYIATLQSVGEDFKLPNDFHSRFSRKAMAEVPELADFFELRELRSK